MNSNKLNKKSYFLTYFTLAQFLLIISSTALLLSGVLFLIIAHFKTSSVTPSHFTLMIEAVVTLLYQGLARFGLIIAILFLCLLLIEVVIRLRHDNLMNLWRSIYLTIILRRFLHQDESSENQKDDQKAQSVNPIHKSFNRAVRQTVIELTDKHAIVCIKLPNGHQAQNILNNMDEEIKNELSDQVSQYYFSAPERQKNKKWFIGTKRD